MKKDIIKIKKLDVVKSVFMVFIAVFFICGFIHPAKAQLKNVIVEKYYISDTNDGTDTTLGNSIIPGSTTYRVFVEVEPGSLLKKIYGDAYHPLIVNSTDNFYNNTDRPNSVFGYQVKKSWFASNPTLALDSYFTIGLAAQQDMGIPKSDDTDGSTISGSNNNGGTAGIPGGLLNNNDPDAGIPLSVADGFVPNQWTFGQWLDYGFKDILGTDTTIFGSVNSGNSFISYDIFLQQNSGVSGAVPGNGKVLVAQFTTNGDLEFELNVEIEDAGSNLIKYVANNDTLLPGEVVSPFLKYPPVCGCKDPDYLEFDPSFSCSVSDSCKTLIQFGCMDTLACNYDAAANFPVPELCCYPGFCNDRDLDLVCPQLSAERIGIINVYPNPASEIVEVSYISNDNQAATISIINSYGTEKKVISNNSFKGQNTATVNLNNLTPGLYMIRVEFNGVSDSKVFIKK